MDILEKAKWQLRRRAFLTRGATGLGMLALNSLLDPWLLAGEKAADPLASHGAVNPLHHIPKAKRVIFLYQAGGPSHLETLDSKPKLAAMDGQSMPDSFTKGHPESPDRRRGDRSATYRCT